MGVSAIHWPELLIGIKLNEELVTAHYLLYRDELTERRKAMVQKAFAMLDKDGSG